MCGMAPSPQQLVDVVEQLLGPFQGEARHDDIAAGGLGRVDDLGDGGLDVRVVVVHAVAVGGFDEDVVAVLQRRQGRE